MSLPAAPNEYLLLHNPKCSKSRATLALLEERGVSFETRRYLDAPLSEAELAEVATRLGKAPHGFVRTGQAEYAEAGLSPDSAGADVLRAMANAPILMERPILVAADRAAIGRPPESVLALLDS